MLNVDPCTLRLLPRTLFWFVTGVARYVYTKQNGLLRSSVRDNFSDSEDL